MLRYTLLLMLSILIFVGCNKVETRPATILSVSSTVELTITPTLTLTPTVTITLTPTPIATTTPELTATTWSTFTYNSVPIISFDYPSGWNVVVFDRPDPNLSIFAKLYSSDGTAGLNFQVYKFEKRHDPRDDVGWFSIPWYRPIAVKDASGIIYIAKSESTSGDQGTNLLSYYYSEKYKLQIYITPGVTLDESILKSPSITDTVSQKFGVYEHIIGSLRFMEPN